MAIGGLCSRSCPLRDFLDTLERLHHCSRACTQRRPSGTRAADARTATRSRRQTCPAAHHSSRRDRCHGVTALLAQLTIVTSMNLPPPVDPTSALVQCHAYPCQRQSPSMPPTPPEQTSETCGNLR